MSAAIILGVAMVTIVYVAAIMVCFLYIRRCVISKTLIALHRLWKLLKFMWIFVPKTSSFEPFQPRTDTVAVCAILSGASARI